MSAVEPSGSVAKIGIVKKMLSIERYARIMHTDIVTPGRWSRCLWEPSGHHPDGFVFVGNPTIFTALRQSMVSGIHLPYLLSE